MVHRKPALTDDVENHIELTDSDGSSCRSEAYPHDEAAAVRTGLPQSATNKAPSAVPSVRGCERASLRSGNDDDDDDGAEADFAAEHDVQRQITLYCSSMTARQWLGIAVGVCPVLVFAFEACEERCTLCLQGVGLDSYYCIAGLCGGLGAVLYGSSSLDAYWHARIAGGTVSALGAMFTIWMLLHSVQGNYVFFFLFLGLLGAMPGLLTYFVLRIMSDECCRRRSIWDDDDDDDDYSWKARYKPLTENMQVHELSLDAGDTDYKDVAESSHRTDSSDDEEDREQHIDVVAT